MFLSIVNIITKVVAEKTLKDELMPLICAHFLNNCIKLKNRFPNEIMFSSTMSQAGVRIRLDLSSFEKVPKKQFRWTYLGYDQFSTVKDVKDYIKANFLPKSEQIKKIRLYLEEPFWIPASESIKILQNGDLILVKTRRDDLANVDESETNGAKKRKLSDPSPSIISNGDVTKRNVALISKPKGKNYFKLKN